MVTKHCGCESFGGRGTHIHTAEKNGLMYTKKFYNAISLGGTMSIISSHLLLYLRIPMQEGFLQQNKQT